MRLLDTNLIDKEIEMKFQKLVRNFDEVSHGDSKYEEATWTLSGLEKHSFLAQQRRLAKELLDDLQTDLTLLPNSAHENT